MAHQGRITRTVRAGVGRDPVHGAVIPPIHLSTTFTFDGLHGRRSYDYSRTGNPTRDLFAEAVADLEGGAGAVVTSSGMAAVLLVLQGLGHQDLVVAPHDCYGGTHRLIRSLAARGDFRARFVDQNDAEALRRALAERPRLVLVETPSNPLLRIVDIVAVAERAHAVGAHVVVDNTFLSPVLQRPLGLGADVVVHSTTKYLNGHSDVVGGAVVAADPDRHEELAWWANCLGLTGSSFDAWLSLRGVRTLHARWAAHERNAREVARALVDHEAASAVFWPGLQGHPGHDVARRQQEGFGAMLSFELAGGLPAVRRFVEGLTCFSLAESLGGVESLVAHPATMTHASMDAESQRIAGITPGLLRLSVGTEDPADLVADLVAGLDRAGEATPVSARVPEGDERPASRGCRAGSPASARAGGTVR